MKEHKCVGDVSDHCVPRTGVFLEMGLYDYFHEYPAESTDYCFAGTYEGLIISSEKSSCVHMFFLVGD